MWVCVLPSVFNLLTIIDLSFDPTEIILLLSNGPAHECFDNICLTEKRRLSVFYIFYEIHVPNVINDKFIL